MLNGKGSPEISPAPDEVARDVDSEKKQYIQRLEIMLSHSDDIPEEIVSPQGEYKVKNNWFMTTLGVILGAKEADWLSRDLALKYDVLDAKYNTKEFHDRRTTREDIVEMSVFAQDVINELKEKKLR
jgi:aspartyl aminopeptidase